MDRKKIDTKPLGTRHAKTRKAGEIARRALEAGVTPLEYMLDLIRAPALIPRPNESRFEFEDRVREDKEFRLAAARFAAPYVHPKMATELKVSTNPQDTKPIDVLELAKSVAFLLTMSEHKRVIDVSPNAIPH